MGDASRKALRIAILAAAVLAAALTAAIASAALRPNGDLYIPAKDVSEKAVFYPIVVEGTKMEVFAVRAPDGTIRTAFNTCQVCFDSGRGYYVQEGDAFVCQNCGNRFRTGSIEIVRGGCNPVPILPANKTTDASGITIPGSFLLQAKRIFANWKTEY